MLRFIINKKALQLFLMLQCFFKIIKEELDFFSVRLKGLEPPRLASLDPKSSAATNYATAAKCENAIAKIVFFLITKQTSPSFIQRMKES